MEYAPFKLTLFFLQMVRAFGSANQLNSNFHSHNFFLEKNDELPKPPQLKKPRLPKPDLSFMFTKERYR